MDRCQIFESLQRNFAYAGIAANLARQSYPFNGAVTFGLLFLGFDIVSLLLFIAYDAEQFDEYTQAVNNLSVLTLITVALLILIVKIKQLFEFIDSGNDLVNISELDTKSILSHRVCRNYAINVVNILGLKYSPSSSIFRKVIRFEQKLSNIIFFILVKVIPVFVCTPVVISAFLKYFATDLGTDAFELIYPMWYVFYLNSFGKSHFNNFDNFLKATV